MRTREELAVRVFEIIAEQGDVELSAVRPSTKIDDLKLDSLAVLEIGMACEEEFEIELPDTLLETWKTVDDIVACVADALGI